MKKSTRALIGLVLIDLILVIGAWWMISQVRSGAWNAPDAGDAIVRIATVFGAAIGIASGVLLVAFVVQRGRGN